MKNKFYLVKTIVKDAHIVEAHEDMYGNLCSFMPANKVELTPKELCMIYDLINDKGGNKEGDTLIEKWRKI